MSLKSLLIFILLGCTVAAPCISSGAEVDKKVSTHVSAAKSGAKGKKARKHKKQNPDPKIKEPGLVIVNRSDSTHPMLCDALCQICFSGYDKRPSSKYESIFITNSMPRHLKRVKVHLTYLDPKGRQLHGRDIVLECDVPPGETRNVTFKSWDKQGNFYYCGAPAPRSAGATPYDITLETIEYQFMP